MSDELLEEFKKNVLHDVEDDINYKEFTGTDDDYCLMYAIANCQFLIAKQLIKEGANIEKANYLLEKFLSYKSFELTDELQKRIAKLNFLIDNGVRSAYASRKARVYHEQCLELAAIYDKIAKTFDRI